MGLLKKLTEPGPCHFLKNPKTAFFEDDMIRPLDLPPAAGGSGGGGEGQGNGATLSSAEVQLHLKVAAAQLALRGAGGGDEVDLVSGELHTPFVCDSAAPRSSISVRRRRSLSWWMRSATSWIGPAATGVTQIWHSLVVAYHAIE